jgi:hypothetical protein
MAARTNPIVWNGVLAPVGQGTVAIGHFGAITDAQIRAAEGNRLNWALVGASFEPWGETVRMGQGLAATGNAGLFHTSFTADVAGTGFLGKPVYVVVGNGSTLLGSDLVVVFKSTFTFQDFPPRPEIQANLIDELAGELLLGNLGPAQVYYTAPGHFLNGLPLTGIHPAQVPEPASALLAALGFGIACMPRRARCL